MPNGRVPVNFELCLEIRPQGYIVFRAEILHINTNHSWRCFRSCALVLVGFYLRKSSRPYVVHSHLSMHPLIALSPQHILPRPQSILLSSRRVFHRFNMARLLSQALTVLRTPQASAFANGDSKADSEVPCAVPPTYRSRTLIL